MGRRNGFGLRWVGPAYPSEPPYTYSRESEAEMLRQEAKRLENSLTEINQRLTQLEEQANNEKSDKK